MPGVVSVQPRVSGGLLDSVLKGAQVARDVYGIRQADAQTDLMNQRAAQEGQNFQDEQAGVFTPKEQVALGRNYAFVPEDTENALPIKVRQGPGEEGLQDVYILPKKSQATPLIKSVENYQTPEGKTGTAFFDLNNPSSGPLAVAPTMKPQKEPTAHFQAIGTDANGQILGLDTTSGQTRVLGEGQLKGQKDPAAVDQKEVVQERKWLSDAFIKDGQRSVIGSIDTQIKGGEKLQTLLNAHPDGQLPPPLQSEVAMGLGKLLMGSNAPSQAEIEKLDPQTRGTFIANLWSKISDVPYSANNPEFIKLFGDTIEREIGTARDQYHQKVAQARYSVPNLFQQDPDAFFGIVGADPREFTTGKNGAFSYAPKVIGRKAADPVVQQQPGIISQMSGNDTATAGTGPSVRPHPQDATALSWANAHLLSPNADQATMARQILQANGGK